MMNLLVIFVAIFICPLFDARIIQVVLPVLFLLILLLVSLSVPHFRRFNLASLGVLLALLVTGLWMESVRIRNLLRMLEFIFFIYLLVLMVWEISTNQLPNGQVVIDAVTGYFLLGMAYTNLVILTAAMVKGAYNLPDLALGGHTERLNHYIYYSFVTYTTTGYGDLIPTHPLSRSLAILIGVSGQLYIAIIIAMLVSKYSNRKADANP